MVSASTLAWGKGGPFSLFPLFVFPSSNCLSPAEMVITRRLRPDAYRATFSSSSLITGSDDEDGKRFSFIIEY